MKLEQRSFTRITLALDIVGRISAGPYKGYHELGTIKHRIDLHDLIEVEDAPRDYLECDNPAVPCDERNVCMQVVRLLKETFSIDRCVRIGIAKRIPVMGGLAGGSANAATTFDLLNDLWELRLPVDALVRLGRRVGMDVPYYFYGATAFDTEAGERLETVPTGLTFSFILAIPEFGVATREAYEGLDYSAIGKETGKTAALRAALIAGNRSLVPPLVHNDFEPPVMARYPRLAEIKRQLVDRGCVASFLTGSGSTVIGLVPDGVDAKTIGRSVDCRTVVTQTAVIDDRTATATA